MDSSTMSKPQPFQFSLRTLLLLFVVLGSSLAVFGAWGIVDFVVVVGLAVYLRHVEFLISLAHLALVVLCLMCLIGLLIPVQPVRESARSAVCLNNLHQIAEALQAYHQANGCFPPAYIADKNGKPMHSWRTLLLPYLDSDVYKAYKFTQPWNGPTNKKLLAYSTATPFYACPNDASPVLPMGALQTTYLAVVGPNAAWAGEKPRKLADFGTDAASTVMLVEVANSDIAWAEPEDFSLETLGLAGAGSPPLPMATEHRLRDNFFFAYDRGSLANVAMADGSVHCLPLGNLSNEDLRSVLQIGGCKGDAIADPVLRLNWPNIAALAVWLLSVGTLLTQAVRSRKVLPVMPPPS